MLLLGLFLLFSCRNSETPEVSNYTFKVPNKNIFVKSSKYNGGVFTLFFAQDSLSLNNSKDFIEFETGSYLQIIIDKTNIYISANKLNGAILNMGKYHFDIIKISSDSIFNSFFESNIQKYPYSFISIDTKEYSICVNQQTIKGGNIYGGW
ncbi:MAG: hypothetical protein LBQ34_06640 [Alphaproteobacteria bacterium]|jgi:hypothetical protein|nr:hypothetical protein [Alphaproteobacteria bacterium]